MTESKVLLVLIGKRWLGEREGAPPRIADADDPVRLEVAARFTERFVFAGEGAELHGSASFLGVPRGVLDGRAEPGGLRFVTRTREDSAEAVHRYTGRLAGDEIRFVMQSEGGASTHVPVEYSARRVQ